MKNTEKIKDILVRCIITKLNGNEYEDLIFCTSYKGIGLTTIDEIEGNYGKVKIIWWGNKISKWENSKEFDRDYAIYGKIKEKYPYQFGLDKYFSKYYFGGMSIIRDRRILKNIDNSLRKQLSKKDTAILKLFEVKWNI